MSAPVLATDRVQLFERKRIRVTGTRYFSASEWFNPEVPDPRLRFDVRLGFRTLYLDKKEHHVPDADHVLSENRLNGALSEDLVAAVGEIYLAHAYDRIRQEARTKAAGGTLLFPDKWWTDSFVRTGGGLLANVRTMWSRDASGPVCVVDAREIPDRFPDLSLFEGRAA